MEENQIKHFFQNFLFGKNNWIYFITQLVIWIFNITLIYILFYK